MHTEKLDYNIPTTMTTTESKEKETKQANSPLQRLNCLKGTSHSTSSISQEAMQNGWDKYGFCLQIPNFEKKSTLNKVQPYRMANHNSFIPGFQTLSKANTFYFNLVIVFFIIIILFPYLRGIL
mmetsp:Transcript_13481/g.22138  ORF Transcript_13481/g.22138 Transcript_13481/m.22138 type:complete len:124 (-) Transcript_13481:1601-1972(-)